MNSWSKHLGWLFAVLLVGVMVLGPADSWAAPKGDSKAAPKATPKANPKETPKAEPKPASKRDAKAAPKAAAATKGSSKSKKASKKEEEPTGPRPWSLRDKFTFTNGKMMLMYGVETSELRLEAAALGVIIDDSSFRITFADGSSVDAAALGKAEGEREAYTCDMGAGTRFWTEYPPKDGLVVRHSVNVNKERPGMFVTLTLGNVGDKPIEIAKICPLIVGPGGIHGLSKEATLTARHFSFRGPFPVFDGKGPVSFNIFRDPTNNTGFTIGMLPMGIATSNAEFKATEAGVWRGEVTCVYDPPIRIEPGKKFESDPMWLTTNEFLPSKVDLDYSWASSVKPRPTFGPDTPQAWVTIPEGGSVDDVCKAVNTWSGAMIKHALIPADWEGRPGSLQGSAPRYPKNMEKAAAQINTAGMKPGLTIDPLLADDGGSYTAASTDGRRWINLAEPEGKKSAIERMKKVAGWGFSFFVVRYSDIPSEVLKQFNMTRAQANSAALAVMAEAAGGRPVFPATSGTVGAGMDEWLEIAASSSRMTEFGVVPGPVRFAATGSESPDKAVLTAMAFFKGPIEFVGAPSGDLSKALASFLPSHRTTARPIDAACAAPKLWQIHVTGPNNEWLGDSVVVFPGAPAWSPKSLEFEKDAQAWLWQSANGQAIDMNAAEIPAPNELTVYGATPNVPHPSLMGASDGPQLLLNDLKNIAWNEAKGILTGTFLGRNHEQATAYVAVPAGWTLDSAKAGDGSISKKNVTDRVQFPVKPGIPTSFELKFVKN